MPIVPADQPVLFAVARDLVREYAASLDFDLCFQNFERELAGFEAEYGAPRGKFLLAFEDGVPAGCVGLRRFAEGIAEMKRLYVRPGFRGRGIGRRLAEAVVAEARVADYRAVRLDTVPVMTTAIALYGSLGFRDVAPYRPNPVPGVRYMELALTVPG
jgi:putative acetyltransferase